MNRFHFRLCRTYDVRESGRCLPVAVQPAFAGHRRAGHVQHSAAAAGADHRFRTLRSRTGTVQISRISAVVAHHPPGNGRWPTLQQVNE